MLGSSSCFGQAEVERVCCVAGSVVAVVSGAGGGEEGREEAVVVRLGGSSDGAEVLGGGQSTVECSEGLDDAVCLVSGGALVSVGAEEAAASEFKEEVGEVEGGGTVVSAGSMDVDGRGLAIALLEEDSGVVREEIEEV